MRLCVCCERYVVLTWLSYQRHKSVVASEELSPSRMQIPLLPCLAIKCVIYWIPGQRYVPQAIILASCIFRVAYRAYGQECARCTWQRFWPPTSRTPGDLYRRARNECIIAT